MMNLRMPLSFFLAGRSVDQGVARLKPRIFKKAGFGCSFGEAEGLNPL
jgi:hypothetical protein